MRKKCIMALCFLLSLLLTGCNTEKDTTEKDLQRLSMLEVYSSDGELVNVIEDTDILYQFNNLDYTDVSIDTDFQQTELEDTTADLSVLYTIISYKFRATVSFFLSETYDDLTLCKGAVGKYPNVTPQT